MANFKNIVSNSAQVNNNNTTNSMNSFSSFNAASNNNAPKNVIRFTFNISSKPSTKNTILAYTHNGTIFNSTQGNAEGSSFMKFRLVSEKQGETKTEVFDDNGICSVVSAQKAVLALFGCQDETELPDALFKCDLGDTDELEESIFNSDNSVKTIMLDVPFTNFYEGNLDAEYKGVNTPTFILSDVKVSFGTSFTGRKMIDAQHIMNAFSSATISSVHTAESLSRYRRVSTKTADATSIHNVVETPKVKTPFVSVKKDEAVTTPNEVSEAPKAAMEMANKSINEEDDIDLDDEFIGEEEEGEIKPFDMSFFTKKAPANTAVKEEVQTETEVKVEPIQEIKEEKEEEVEEEDSFDFDAVCGLDNDTEEEEDDVQPKTSSNTAIVNLDDLFSAPKATEVHADLIKESNESNVPNCI